MKKFTFKGVLDGFRQSVQPQIIRQELEIPELLRAEHFSLKRTFRHGFPYSPTAFAFDPVQKLMAIGDKSGNLRIIGRPGVDAYAKHDTESECAVILVEFLVNDGLLVTVTADDTVHLWDIHEKIPQVIQSLKFQRERVTCLHVPVGSKWFYVGTEKGNVHVINANTFALSGYVINWNKAIEVIRTSHPGAVIALCDSPIDGNKLLIAFECGLLVLWDLKAKSAEIRWQASDPLKSLSWHYDGKYFISSHVDGSICSWPTKSTQKPQSIIYPHARPAKDGSLDRCKPIYKVEVKTAQTSETYTIFSGGMPTERSLKSNCITIMLGKTTTLMEMEHPVVDFITLCENPWACETQEPYAIAVLLENDLVLIDLLTPGFPCFESPYPMDLHESPVTCCTYLTDCPSDLVPALYSVGRNTTHKKSEFSEKEWPISGGEWSPVSCSYAEIIVTGHQDGSVKFWDSGAGTMQILYKLKTAKIFEKLRNSVSENGSDNPLAVQLIYLCSQSRRLCVAGSMGQVLLFKFRKSETNSETLVLEIPILYENFDDVYGTSPECDFVPKCDPNESEKPDFQLKVKSGLQRKIPGFQTQLVCLTTGPNRGVVQITSLCLNSSYGLMAYGTEHGLVVIDIVQKVCLLSVACPDLYGAYDPYSRTPKSPKRLEMKEEQSRSPSSDQISEVTKDTNDLSSENDVFKNPCGGVPASRPPTASEAASSSNEHPVSDSPSAFDTTMHQQPVQQQSVTSESIKKSKSQEKLDGSFSRSRSSSISSIDMSSSESVTCLSFIESPIKKNDGLAPVPTLWIGTNFGSILTLFITLPEKETRKAHPVLLVINGGPVVRLKGTINSMSFLDSCGSIIPKTFEQWRDERELKKERTPTKNSTKTSPACTPTSSSSNVAGSSACSTNASGINAGSEPTIERQYLVIASEKQIKVFDVVSQCCINRLQFSETDFIVKAETISMKDGSCIATYLSNGHLTVHSLPGIKLLLDSDFLPLLELSFQTKCQQGIVDPMLSIWGQQIIVHEDTTQISKIFCFSHKGHGLYLASPTEIQKFTTSAEFCQFIMDMKGDLFTPQIMPEQPKEGFFKGLFGGGAKSLDREELFGEQSGKANRSIAKHIPGATFEQLGQRASTAASEISRAHQLAMERGEKLNLLEERAERMANQAQDFSGTAHQLMLKYKDKKWYQL